MTHILQIYLLKIYKITFEIHNKYYFLSSKSLWCFQNPGDKKIHIKVKKTNIFDYEDMTIKWITSKF